MRTKLALSLGALMLFWESPAGAVTITDPIGDYAPGYNGTAADLDVTSFSVTYNSVTQRFLLGATMAGTIDPLTGGVYIIGVNTGTGPTAPFAALNAPNVRFNQTVRINKNGTGTVGTTPITATMLTDGFEVSLAASLFPSTGFAPVDYGWNLWPRTGVGTGTMVTDFAPNNATLAASVPEPGAWAMLIVGLGLVGGALRRRRRPALA